MSAVIMSRQGLAHIDRIIELEKELSHKDALIKKLIKGNEFYGDHYTWSYNEITHDDLDPYAVVSGVNPEHYIGGKLAREIAQDPLYKEILKEME